MEGNQQPTTPRHRPAPKPTPWSYIFIRLLFKFVLKVFYGTIVIENEHYIPDNGEPVIICANHTNSLTDALVLVTSVPWNKRNFIRLTAKDTQFGRKTFQSWLIESAGTIPIKRRQDHTQNDVDNSQAMGKLMDALEEGDAVGLFPEGFSRYHPTMAPLKTGVARIVSDVLTRNKHDPEFGVTILTCSITYMHRQSFRSDVLVSFNPPLKLTVRENANLISTPDAPADFAHIRSLTSFMHAQLSSNTIDAPSWDLVRAAKTAARIYVPFGTEMGLGDWVRVVARFVVGFVVPSATLQEPAPPAPEVVENPVKERKVRGPRSEGSTAGDSQATNEEEQAAVHEREQLVNDLRIYQDRLLTLGLKDDRIRRTEDTPRALLLWRLIIRMATTAGLLVISLPGLILWAPIFATTGYFVKKLKASGPTWDTQDEIAQTKLLYGLGTGSLVCMTSVGLGKYYLDWPVTMTMWVIPGWMWLTLRWTEDLVSAFRASMALYRLVTIPDAELRRIREGRKALYHRVMTVAESLGLPSDPEQEFIRMKKNIEEVTETGWIRRRDRKGTVRGRWDSAAQYFSIRRRRKRDWNETLRWFDATEFPTD